MSTLDEQQLGDLRWIVVRGAGQQAFRALGGHLRGEIAEYLAGSPLLPLLRRHVASDQGRERLAAVLHASRQRHPDVWDELVALADGAQVDVDDLALLNVRGDLGPVSAGYGCSDLAWRRGSSFIAHNEDGDAYDLGRCLLVTLALEGLPTVTAFWYPGFLPSNAFGVTGDGLVWTIDSLTIERPGEHAGRHFVARGLQRTAHTVDDAVDYLAGHPSAGGFAHQFGDRSGRVVSVDAAASRSEWVEAGPAGGVGPLVWHTNHPRYLPDAGCRPSESSARRGAVLESVPAPDQEPDARWFLRVLTGGTPPAGVRAEPSPGSSAATLCTLVADLTAGEAVLQVAGGEPVAIPLADLAAGTAQRQRALG